MCTMTRSPPLSSGSGTRGGWGRWPRSRFTGPEPSWDKASDPVCSGASWKWPCPLPWESVGETASPLPSCLGSFPSLSELRQKALCALFTAALPAATAQVWKPNLCRLQGAGAGWVSYPGLRGLRGQRAISLTPVLSLRSLRRKSTGTRPNTQGVVLGASRCLVWPVGVRVFSSALTWVFTHTHPPNPGGVRPWQLGVVTVACLPLCQTWVHTTCTVLCVILTMSLRGRDCSSSLLQWRTLRLRGEAVV